MTMLRILLAAVLLAAAPAHAQTPANAEEIAFWETVRDSKNPAELQAYIDNYPNGRFVVLAKARLAALQKPAAQPAAPVARPSAAAAVTLAVPSGSRLPQAGDTWTYRLTYPKRFGVPAPQPSVRTVIVKVDSASNAAIVDQVLVDGAAAVSSQHTPGAYLLTQGVSVFSPYFEAFGSAPPRYSPVGNVTIQEPQCRSTHFCTASARVVGTEQVTVAAGTFNAVRIVIDESWRPGPSATTLGQFGMAQANGGRTLTVWYAPEVKRAVKYSSRHNVGDVPPVETHFDLELVSYQLK